jgi:ribosomal-protein-alanine N-acetyltransferase
VRVPYLVAPTVPVGSLCSNDQPVLHAGDDLRLRPWRDADAPALMRAYQDPEIQRWHVRRADSVAEAQSWLVAWRGGWATETEASWAIVDASSDELLGRAALKHLTFTDGSADVAYWTVPAARGRGVAPRAVATMSAWALGEAGFHRLDLAHAVGNVASCRVAAKVGFEPEGVQRSAWLQTDGRHDVHLHARIRPN